jgi:GNAT superfamily N-acetyltransferase
MDVHIRNATIHDLPAIDSFDVFSGDRKPDIEAGEIIVAVWNEEVVAFLKHNKRFYSRPFVSLVCVKKEHRRKGILKQLFKYVEDIYRGQPLLFTSTEADNFEMLSFLQKYGYQPSGSIENIQKVSELVFVKRF